MKIHALIFTAVLLLLSGSTPEHPLKMSSSKLTISTEGVAKVQSRIFLDDLTEHMQNLYNIPQADFSTTTSNGVRALQGYLRDHFYFEQGEKKIYLSINSVSLSKNQLALVVDMSAFDQLDLTKEVFLVNTLLCDAFPLQSNDIYYGKFLYLLNIGSPKAKLRIQ